MADYESDSSGMDDVGTNVMLGYASKEPTIDDFSQLGGHPSWFNGAASPSGAFAKCKVCNGLMNLLLQINGDLPEQFPGHERRLYILACRRKPCRRKDGSFRGFRATRQTKSVDPAGSIAAPKEEDVAEAPAAQQPARNLGETLFGATLTSQGRSNPFSTQNTALTSSNHFASTSPSLAAKAPQSPTATSSLPETFAQKARISVPDSIKPSISVPYEPWPQPSAFPTPFPSCHLDADTEYIDREPQATPAGVRVEASAANGEGGSSSAAEDKALFESSMDKTFQRFADRLAQNPEQVLRYEFGGQALLYSKSDAVGRLLAPAQQASGEAKVKTAGASSSGGGAGMPRCQNCGAARVFELQLTPQLIAELEADAVAVDDGMDWGTVILGVCGADCMERGKGGREGGDVGYVEEWVGVQWEELAGANKQS